MSQVFYHSIIVSRSCCSWSSSEGLSMVLYSRASSAKSLIVVWDDILAPVVHIQQKHHCSLWNPGEDWRISGGCPIKDYSVLAMTQPRLNPLDERGMLAFNRTREMKRGFQQINDVNRRPYRGRFRRGRCYRRWGRAQNLTEQSQSTLHPEGAQSSSEQSESRDNLN